MAHALDNLIKKIIMPAWSFLPIKLVVLAGFLVPVYIWFDSVNSLSFEFPSLVHASDKGTNNSAGKGSAQQMTGMTTISTSHLQGVDVSHYQGTVKWEKVAESGVKFAFAKATGGVDYVDPQFKVNWHGMRANEIYRGAYHFFYASDDAEKQADHYLSTVGALSVHDIPPVVDVEILDNTSPDKLVEGVLVWLEKVEQATGRRPIIYTDLSFGVQYLSDPRFKEYYLWIADYGPTLGTLPSPWVQQSWQFWQYSQSGSISGIAGDVDQNHYSGDLEKLKHFINDSKSE